MKPGAKDAQAQANPACINFECWTRRPLPLSRETRRPSLYHLHPNLAATSALRPQNSVRPPSCSGPWCFPFPPKPTCKPLHKGPSIIASSQGQVYGGLSNCHTRFYEYREGASYEPQAKHAVPSPTSKAECICPYKNPWYQPLACKFIHR